MINEIKYKEHREQQKKFINKFEELNKVKTIKNNQFISDYKHAKESLKLSFKEWLVEENKKQNVRGVCI